jgi:hypothetical protein
MTARVLHFKNVVHRHLFADLNADAQGLAVLEADARAFVQRELGVDEIAVVVDQPLHAHAISIEDLLVGLEHNEYVPIGFAAFPPVTNKVGNERGRHELIVACPAAVEEAIVLQQLERIDRPVLTLCFDRIEMS